MKVAVLDINKAKKEVTVKDEAGDVSIVEVPKHFTLEKVKVGDVVTLSYAETVTVALAKPGEMDSVSAKKTRPAVPPPSRGSSRSRLSTWRSPP